MSINNRAHSAIRYWIGEGDYNNWSNSANWFTSTGGVGGAMLPSAADRAIFDGVGTGA